MYYKEKMIKGVLHFKSMPNGEWQPVSAIKLSNMVIALRKSNEELHKALNKCQAQLAGAENVLEDF